jgi:EAL domain-containing protein (putative c-di-GMP-specific phosphodiesterase class I)/CheY-like chemotaxis protein
MSAADDKGHVLVVDDDDDLRDTCAEVLAAAGYRVDTAADGAAAMNLIWMTPLDVVLTDIAMPGMDGLQLLRSVRARDLDVPVLLMTGDPTVETAVQALEHGALKYLRKPIQEADLIAAVEHAVRLHRMAMLKREALTHLGARDKLLGDRASLEAGLGRALATLRMAYQPIVRADDRRVYGYEALVRVEEPTLPNPGALFDAAERLGCVTELGRAIRETVAASMENMDGLADGIIVFVNLHSIELSDDALFAPDSPLSKHAKSVVLEITERASLEATPDLRRRVSELRGLGYKIAVDDLGAGYAGLTSFAALEPEVVKLDMTLVRGVDHEPIRRKLVGSMTELCRQLGILVVAEGVETEAERDALVDLRCDLLQGYLFGRPVFR